MEVAQVTVKEVEAEVAVLGIEIQALYTILVVAEWAAMVAAIMKLG